MARVRGASCGLTETCFRDSGLCVEIFFWRKLVPRWSGLMWGKNKPSQELIILGLHQHDCSIRSLIGRHTYHLRGTFSPSFDWVFRLGRWTSFYVVGPLLSPDRMTRFDRLFCKVRSVYANTDRHRSCTPFGSNQASLENIFPRFYICGLLSRRRRILCQSEVVLWCCVVEE